MTTRRELGGAIRRARNAAGLTQADIGRRLRPPRSHVAVSDIETGKTGCDIEDITEMAAILGVSLVSLVCPESGSPDVLARLEALEARVFGGVPADGGGRDSGRGGEGVSRITDNEIQKLRNDLDDGKPVDEIAVRAALSYIEYLRGLCGESLALIDATWTTATPLSAKLRQVVCDSAAEEAT